MDSFSEIRRNAREVWSRKDNRLTSYQSYFNEKLQDTEPVPYGLSAENRNRPHPPPIFMTCRLHMIPGYYNPNAAQGRDHSATEGRYTPRPRYVRKPSSIALRQYAGNEKYEYLDGPLERQATTAWDKINPDRNRTSHLHNALEDWKGQTNSQKTSRSNDDEIMSLRGYMKMAAENQAAVPSESLTSRQNVMTLGQLKAQDIRQIGKFRLRPVRPTRGDFSIHPEWPPTLKHHRLNGFQYPAGPVN